MKKGDIKKQEILRTAEELFCRKGYEETSIQDILDELKTSKGSFYHHFESKEALLEALCFRRAEKSLEITRAGARGDTGAAEKLNHMLAGMIPLHDEKLSFILMLLPTFALPEGRSVKAAYCRALETAFHAPVREILEEGAGDGSFLCHDTDLCTEIVILIVNQLWVKICDTIIRNEAGGKETDVAELLHMIEEYRTAAERILSVSYGSLALIEIPFLKGLVEQIHIHWA